MSRQIYAVCLKCLFSLVLLVSIGLPALGQSSSAAAVDGIVEDTTDARIPNASVKLINTDTGTGSNSTTSKDGIFSIPSVLPGHYRLQIEREGFDTTQLTGITLNVGDNKQVIIRMKVGSSQQTITVDGSGIQINTTDASVSTIIDRKFVENIPLNGRSFQDLISMTPGVVTQNPQAGSAIGNSGDFSINGQRTESNYYMVDGVSGNLNAGSGYGLSGGSSGNGTTAASTALGTTQSLVSVDALQEFRVLSSTYSAEYGHSPGGQLSFVTRSGTNRIHGTAFDYLRNNYFDANDWFNNDFQRTATALRQNDFGGTVGGPIYVPKLYEEHNRSFFFVSYEGLRLTQPQAASIQYVPDSYMRSQAAPALQPILNAYPIQNGMDLGTPANPGLAQFILPYSLPSSIDSTSVRLDHTLSARLSLFFRVGITPSVTRTRSLSSVTSTSSNTQTYTLGATSQLSKAISNEFRLGYSRADSAISGNLDDFGGATPVNLASAMGAGSYSSALPIFILLSGSNTSTLESINSSNLGRQWNVLETLSLAHGQHHLKFGGEYRRLKFSLIPPSPELEAEYTSNSSLVTNTPSLLLVEQFKNSTPIFNAGSVFAQDDWRIATNLSLSLGVRWELAPPPTEQHGDDAYTLLGNVAVPSTLVLAPQGTPLWRTYKYNFAPRLGMAWTAHSNPGWETVVRAGGGVFFDSLNEPATRGYGAVGFQAERLYAGSPLPATPAQFDFSPSTTPPYTSSIVYAFPAHLQLPYTLQWNVSLQQAVGKAQTATISYVASNGRRLVNLQALTLTAHNPHFGSVDVFPGGLTSNYQSLQLQFQRSITGGLQALASYAWSHSIDFGSTYITFASTRGNSDFDVRHNLSGGLSWNLPLVRTNEVAAATVNGWTIDGRISSRTAFPITLAGNTLTDPATGTLYNGGVNVVPNVPIYLYGRQCSNLPSSKCPGGRTINKAAFAAVTSGAAGNAPRNFVRGFAEDQINLAIRRDFPIHEAVVLQFRAEAFNVLNHPNFGSLDPRLADATFGQALKMLNQSLGTVASQYQQGGPRSMQFALKLLF